MTITFAIKVTNMQNSSVSMIYSSGLIWFLAIFGGFLPVVLKGVNRPVNSMMNMVAAGIFLACSIVHLLPDAVENEKLAKLACFPDKGNEDSKCLPIAYVLYGMGFLLVLSIEILAHQLEALFIDHSHHPCAAHNPCETKHLIVNEKLHVENYNSTTSDQQTINGTKGGLENGEVDNSYHIEGMEIAHAHIHGIIHGQAILAGVVFFALSFHSVMEGLGIGASVEFPWGILIAVLAHKSLAAFALSSEMISHGISKKKIILSIAFFSIMTPIGIFIGRLISDISSTSVPSSVCTALAGGTFLFVPVMEIIPQELQDPKYKSLKLVSLLLGFSMFSSLAVWV